MKLTKRQSFTIFKALIRAIEWEDSLAEAWGAGTPERAESLQLVGEFEVLLEAIFPGSKRKPFTGKTVRIQDLLLEPVQTKSPPVP